MMLPIYMYTVIQCLLWGYASGRISDWTK